MTKRERESIARKIEALVTKVGKKRDEIRALAEDAAALIASVEDAAEEMDWSVQHLKDARRSLDDAADKASQYA